MEDKRSSDGEERILPATCLFRFSVPCHKLERCAVDIELAEPYRIASFGELDGRQAFADLRLGWHPDGMVVSLRINGKQQPPWCNEARPGESDHLSLFVDTRNTQNIHRATRFCHHFVMMPRGRGPRLEEPVASLANIPRARENPQPLAAGAIKIHSEKRIDGYLLQAMLPAEALTGYDPGEQEALGFCYSVQDRELGIQTFAIPDHYPIDIDPSLWGTLQLQARHG